MGTPMPSPTSYWASLKTFEKNRPICDVHNPDKQHSKKYQPIFENIGTLSQFFSNKNWKWRGKKYDAITIKVECNSKNSIKITFNSKLYLVKFFSVFLLKFFLVFDII